LILSGAVVELETDIQGIASPLHLNLMNLTQNFLKQKRSLTSTDLQGTAGTVRCWLAEARTVQLLELADVYWRRRHGARASKHRPAVCNDFVGAQRSSHR
jgi:hypothetical protein